MNSIQGIGSVGTAGFASHQPPDPHARARNLQKQLDGLLDGIPSPTRLNVAVDDALHRIVVQVVDVNTGDVLRQIPHEEALSFAREMARRGSGR